jgi:hypothetical protein
MLIHFRQTQHPTPLSNNNMNSTTSAPRTNSTMAASSLVSYPSLPWDLLLNANSRAQQHHHQQHQHQHQQRILGEREVFLIFRNAKRRAQLLHRQQQRALSEREVFLIFIKMLFTCIERSGNVRLRQHAKAIVSECTRRNRMGDSDYSPLQVAVETRLKNVVVEMFWNQAKIYTDYYCQQKGYRTAVNV